MQASRVRGTEGFFFTRPTATRTLANSKTLKDSSFASDFPTTRLRARPAPTPAAAFLVSGSAGDPTAPIRAAAKASQQSDQGA
jgi:hypothetical protein